MSFVDSLLKHSPKKLSVLLVDKRAAPGGHWNDAYGFVTLHQPARNYGVESSKLEAGTAHPELLASRAGWCSVTKPYASFQWPPGAARLSTSRIESFLGECLSSESTNDIPEAPAPTTQ